ncbi:nucleotide exchange factor GrpE, partial [Spirillospora sp. NPDC049652]
PAPGAPGAPAAEPESGEAAAFKEQLAERTADLQRLKAEYDNYRRRVERDRVVVREQALANVLSELLPVLDDIGRARDHNELTGGFKSVADALEGVTGKLGLERFGEKGEPFDPTVHEALMHAYSAEVTETSVADVLQPGYRIGERVLRPARVAVAEPQDGDAAEQADDDRPE